MLIRQRTATGHVVWVGFALTILHGCSLTDFTYLGAGDETVSTDDTSDETEPTDTSSSSSTEPLDAGTDASSVILDASSTSTEPDGSMPAAPEAGPEPDASVVTSGDSGTSTTDASSSSSTGETTTDESTYQDAGPPVNLVVNSSFEDGLSAGWSPLGMATIASSEDAAHTGERSVVCLNRKAEWEGPSLNVTSLVEAGKSYTFSGWVRKVEGNVSPIGVTLKHICWTDDELGPEVYSRIAFTETDVEWAQIEGVWLMEDCQLATAVVYFEGPPAGEGFYLDDVSIMEFR